MTSEVNACGCAEGPETYATYVFNGSIFVPTTPMGAIPRCSPVTLSRSARRGGAPAHFVAAACADGWAVAQGANGSRRVGGLFEQVSRHWQAISVSDCRASGLPSGAGADEYAIPFTVLRSLGKRIGENVAWTLYVPPLASADGLNRSSCT